jgi:hypothetical protein
MNATFFVWLPLALLCGCLMAGPADAHEGDDGAGAAAMAGLSAAHCAGHGHADAHAPIGVMTDHTHKTGELMLSYRYMYMAMDGNRDGTDRVSNAEVLAAYPVAPTHMTMEMHMFGAMYATSDRLTWTLMAPYIKASMDHLAMGGAVGFTTRSEGIGDVRAGAMLVLHEGAADHLHASLGVSLPTGSIAQRDDTPAMADARLPYPMQLGSGTYDVLPGLTYVRRFASGSWGSQVSGTIRTGENDRDYTLGDRAALTAWVARRWSDGVSTSLRVAGESWGDIDGADPALNPAMVATADAGLRGGSRIDVLAGVNLLGKTGPLAGHRLAAEFGVPVYQRLDGPQLETDWSMMLGWQYVL